MTYRIRRAEPEDAQALLDYLKSLAQEPDIDLPIRSDDIHYTLEQEQGIIRDYTEDEAALFLVAEASDHAGGLIVGVLTCRASKRAAMRHDAGLGISVRRGYRGQGIGSDLLARLLDWAREGGLIRRLHLEVYARNSRAIALYKRFGFQVEGRHRRAIYQDGVYLDEYAMARLL
jgi:RimJ/RimL family protein N-acetyltransferase